MRHKQGLFIALILWGTTSGIGAYAGELVTDSNVLELKVGAEIDPQKDIHLKAGDRISVIDLDTGTSTEFRGPYSGSLVKYVDPCTDDATRSETCGKAINSDIGATRGDVGTTKVGK